MTDTADIHGFFFVPPVDNNFIGHQLAEIYRDRVYAPFVEDKKDLTILDIGGNIGMTAYYFSRYAKDVYVVEPSLEHFDILTRMISFNKLKNVHPINRAVYMKEGKLPLFHNHNKTMYSLHGAVASPDLKEEMVDCITVEGIINENKIEKVDLMKLDVEGSETEILSGSAFKAVAPKINTIIIERHAWSGRNENQLVDVLRSLGYQVSVIPNQADLVVATR
jgi:FkbM family methyltransferase